MSGWWSLEVTPAVGGFQGPKHNRVGELQVPNSRAKWALGKVIGTAIQQTATVRVTRLFLDPYLLKHFIFFNLCRFPVFKSAFIVGLHSSATQRFFFFEK